MLCSDHAQAVWQPSSAREQTFFLTPSAGIGQCDVRAGVVVLMACPGWRAQ